MNKKAARFANPQKAALGGQPLLPATGEFYNIAAPESSDSEDDSDSSLKKEDDEVSEDNDKTVFEVNPTTGLTLPQQLRKEYQQQILAGLVAPPPPPPAHTS